MVWPEIRDATRNFGRWLFVTPFRQARNTVGNHPRIRNTANWVARVGALGLIGYIGYKGYQGAKTGTNYLGKKYHQTSSWIHRTNYSHNFPTTERTNLTGNDYSFHVPLTKIGGKDYVIENLKRDNEVLVDGKIVPDHLDFYAIDKEVIKLFGKSKNVELKGLEYVFVPIKKSQEYTGEYEIAKNNGLEKIANEINNLSFYLKEEKNELYMPEKGLFMNNNFKINEEGYLWFENGTIKISNTENQPVAVLYKQEDSDLYLNSKKEKLIIEGIPYAMIEGKIVSNSKALNHQQNPSLGPAPQKEDLTPVLISPKKVKH